MVISNTLHTAALGGLELAANKALQLDPSTQAKLSALKDHIFLLQCTAPKLNFYLIPGAGEVRICGMFDGKADTAITGSATEFAKLATAADPASALINGELELHGDSQALITLQKIIKQLDLDWEAPLANIFGDVVGHGLGQGLRQGFSFSKQALQGLKRQFDEFIVEESELVPARWQVDQFFNEVDQLSMRTERLQAQLKKYKQRLQK
ncbi:SCP2 domain-containing protein [Oceanicoccus sp. KOV_DT_Chl]|uniref:ubiquinone biosynthesis accessory factor UbiJ n=1 Tax=Oceanicoccus sp. KOV_DT_Chl TaxID=1904639 RepID=UPI000C7BE8D3|nr:SCP2 sterol-binding domain-containing protein [Oceanicoccus sp. KOV_DT_Chl]